ncbi:MAG: hypothetical protein ABWX92_08250 [Mycetocola sp.]
MADDTRRPPGDDDETPVDPPTGENDVAGADWLISQLDAAPTGQFDTRQAPREGADGGDSPVLAWWREKLVAADALVNPEPRLVVEDAAGTDAADTDVIDKDATGADGTDTADTSVVDAPVVDAAAERPAAVENVGDVTSPLPEPARFEPRGAETAEPDSSTGPVPAFLPEPAWAHEPIRAPGDVDATTSFDRQPEAELEDEAETGLIPSFESPMFTPRSARDFVVDQTAESDQSDSDERDFEEPEGSDAQADPAHEPLRAPVFTPPAPDSNFDSTPKSSPESNPEPAEGARTPERDVPYETEDLDNFSWGLTANDQLDPQVHAPVTGRDAAGATPPDAAIFPVGERGAEVRAEAETRRQAPVDHEEALPKSADVTTPAQSGPRRRTFTDMESPSVPPPSVEPPGRPLRAARPSVRSAVARAPRPVILAAIGVVALLVLVGLFFLGSRLPALLAGPAASSSPAPTATPAPTTPAAPAAPVGPAALGEQQWTALGGGECVDPYSTPWAETFTVVDCGAPHAAQMVFTAPVAEDPAAEYPGEDEILSQISLWCSAPGVLDPAAAESYSDLQVQGTYPVSAEQWAAGQRNYYCFVDRSSGEPLNGSVAAPQG